MTWIDVASDAVKIGLGAIVGGIFALLAALTAHHHKKSEEYTRRRRDKLEQIASEFGVVSLNGLTKAASLCSYFSSNIPDGALYEQLEHELAEKQTPMKCLTDLHSIEAQLALLGFPHIAELVEDYRHGFCALDSIDESALSHSEKQQKAESLAAELNSSRTLIVTHLSLAYKNA